MLLDAHHAPMPQCPLSCVYIQEMHPIAEHRSIDHNARETLNVVDFLQLLALRKSAHDSTCLALLSLGVQPDP